MKINIRSAQEKDAQGIGHVHVAAWKTTYHGIVAPAFLESLSPEERAQAAAKRIQNPQIDCFVAVDEDTEQVIGFAHVGPCREKNLDVEGELQAVYLLEKYQGQGIGRNLFDVSVEALKKRGFKDFFVSVLSENKNSLQFYKKMGGELIGHDHVDLSNQRHITDTFKWSLTEGS